MKLIKSAEVRTTKALLTANVYENDAGLRNMELVGEIIPPAPQKKPGTMTPVMVTTNFSARSDFKNDFDLDKEIEEILELHRKDLGYLTQKIEK